MRNVKVPTTRDISTEADKTLGTSIQVKSKSSALISKSSSMMDQKKGKARCEHGRKMAHTKETC